MRSPYATTFTQSQSAERPPTIRWIDWLTAARCRVILAVILTVGFLYQIYYLHHCPIDLSGDEAHYWDWSRQLDWSYYSKGPAVAFIIRASCAIFGDTMPAVRYPAIVLAIATSLISYLLTLKLFRSDRLALGVVILGALVPMFVAGSMLMTIDPPFVFSWAVATYLITFAIFDGKRWAWPAAGLVIGLGFLAKYAALLWLPGVLIFLLIDRASRPLLKSTGPWVMVLMALVCTAPVIVWNVQHDWVTARHVAHQTGMDDDNDDDVAELKSPVKPILGVIGRWAEFVGGQFGAVGPITVFMVGGTVYAFSRRRADDPNRRALQLLVVIGGFFFMLTMLDTLRGKVQVNWPAPTYFTLVIVAGYFLANRFADRPNWHRWRGWAYGTVIYGMIIWPVTHDFTTIYPVVRAANHVLKKPFNVARIDPTVKLRGWHELGDLLGQILPTLQPGAFILCDDYQQTAQTAFYTPGQPITYYAGSYFSDPKPKRHTQYDIWPDRQLNPPNPLVGRDAIYIAKGGGIPSDIVRAFDRVEPIPPLDITSDGEKIRTFRTYRCFGFKSMNRPSADSAY